MKLYISLQTFLYDKSVVRVNSTLVTYGDPDLRLQEGTTVEQLREKMDVYLRQTHGHSSIDLLLKLIEFSDFNHDEKVGQLFSIISIINN